jgi:hypothetical protein
MLLLNYLTQKKNWVSLRDLLGGQNVRKKYLDKNHLKIFEINFLIRGCDFKENV